MNLPLTRFGLCIQLNNLWNYFNEKPKIKGPLRGRSWGPQVPSLGTQEAYAKRIIEPGIEAVGVRTTKKYTAK